MRKDNLLFIVSLVFSLFLFVCCNKNTNFNNSVYIIQAVRSKIFPVKVEEGKGVAELSISAARVVEGTDASVKIEVAGAEYLDQFNKENNTSYSLLSDSAYAMESNTVTIKAGGAISTPLKLNIDINKWKSYRHGKLYVIPVKINSVGNGLSVVKTSEVVLVQLQSVITTNTVTLGRVRSNRTTGFKAPADILIDKATGSRYENFTVEGRVMAAGLWDNNTAGHVWYNLLLGMPGVFFHVDSKGIIGIFGGPGFSIGNMQLKQWYHFAIVCKGSEATFYMDGEPVRSKEIGTAAGQLGFGQTSGSAQLTISEYRVWKTARSKAQINDFMCAVDPSDPTLRAYWPFNSDIKETCLKDISGNGMNLVESDSDSYPAKLTLLKSVKCPEK